MEELNDLNITKMIEIDYENIGTEFMNQAINYHKIYSLYVKMNTEFDFLSQRIKVFTAEKALNIRENTVSRVTDKALEYQLEADKDIVNLKMERIKLQEKRDYLYGVLKALETKKEMLKSLGYTINKQDLA